MIHRLLQHFSKEREFKMIWEVEKDGNSSWLAGSAHFFPYHFRTSLRRYIERVETVLFEGPLDETAADEVAEAGLAGSEAVSLVGLLQPRTMRRIESDVRSASQGLSSQALYLRMLDAHPEELDSDRLKGMRPWMAFFQIWSKYLRQNGWTHTMELDALRIATELRRPVHFLETIEEQVGALDGVPLGRFVNFLENVNWRASRRDHVRHYLKGDLEGLMARAGAFPTRCDSIIGKRDPILYTRMRGFFERGRTVAFVGTSHCPGIRASLTADGYRLGPASTG
ncbi:MAG TPA: TraB/GumN family protein [Candidatus Methylomirabilis sp.]|nr:TraB/GumN family protein [Candidatus Methylomirabilis sp.]